MTTNTPTTTPRHAHSSHAHSGELARIERLERWLKLVGIGALTATVVVVGMATTMSRTAAENARGLRSDQASTARLQGLSDQYEAVRTARAEQASSARLEGLADHHQATTTTRTVEQGWAAGPGDGIASTITSNDAAATAIAREKEAILAGSIVGTNSTSKEAPAAIANSPAAANALRQDG